MRFLVSSLFAVVLLLSACASASGPSSPSGAARRSSQLIAREELEPMANLSAFDAIRLLRPRWLQRRPNVSLAGPSQLPVVVVDGARFGTLEDLRQIIVEDVENMRFLQERDATTKYGTGYRGGVIEVTTRIR